MSKFKYEDFECEIQTELDFLRYFYDTVGAALGSASEDIYDLTRQDYLSEGNEIPKGY